MNYLVNLCIAIINLPACVHRIHSDLTAQKQRTEQLTHQIIRLETTLEMHLATHPHKK
jgi:hypothetical protein